MKKINVYDTSVIEVIFEGENCKESHYMTLDQNTDVWGYGGVYTDDFWKEFLDSFWKELRDYEKVIFYEINLDTCEKYKIYENDICELPFI